MPDVTLDMMEYATDADAQAAYAPQDHPFVAGPTHLWRMSEPSATIVDATGNGATLTLINLTTASLNWPGYLAGKFAGKVMKFGGNNTVGSLANGTIQATTFNGASDFSICFWYYNDNNTAPVHGMFCLGYGVASSNTMLGLSASSNSGYYHAYNYAVFDGDIGSTALSNTTWTWCYLEWDASEHKLYMYKSNSADATASWDYGSAPTFGTGFAIGAGTYAYTNYCCRGAVEDFAMFPRFLTAAERAWIYNSGTGRQIPAVVSAIVSKSENTIKTQGSYALKGVSNILNTGATGGIIIPSGANTSHYFSSSGTFTPKNSGNIIIECWGGGGGGGVVAASGGGGGGGGGYSKTNAFAAAGGTGYTVTVGADGTEEGAGGNTSFNTSTTYANGGGAASNETKGTGGSTGGSAAGDTKSAGGNGGTGTTSGDDGGGGGGAGGADGAGKNSTDASLNTPTAGAQGDNTSGGAGGTLVSSNNGNPGASHIKGGGGGAGGYDGKFGGRGGFPGGGGGGGEITGGGFGVTGGPGLVIITYVTNTQCSNSLMRSIS